MWREKWKQSSLHPSVNSMLKWQPLCRKPTTLIEKTTSLDKRDQFIYTTKFLIMNTILPCYKLCLSIPPTLHSTVLATAMSLRHNQRHCQCHYQCHCQWHWLPMSLSVSLSLTVSLSVTLTANITVSVTDSDTASVNVGVTGSVSVTVIVSDTDSDTGSVLYPHYKIIHQALDNVSTFFFGSALALSKARRTLSSWCNLCCSIFSSLAFNLLSFSFACNVNKRWLFVYDKMDDKQISFWESYSIVNLVLSGVTATIAAW